jgi:hypothetical protein
MTYRELIQAAKHDEPLDQEPTWVQEQVMAFARGWRASPVHYCVAIAVGLVLLGILFVHVSVPSHVRLESTPDGARVTVDGKDVGQTPIVLKDLDRREHKLELSKPGFELFQSYFTVSAGAPSSYQFSLRRLAPSEPPMPIAEAPVRGPSLALADTTPTASPSVADQFRSSGTARGSKRHKSSRRHR